MGWITRRRSHYSWAAFLLVGCWSSESAGYEAGLAKPCDSSSAGGNVGRSTEVISCSSHSSAWEQTTKHTLALPGPEPITSEGAQRRESNGQAQSCMTQFKPGSGGDRKAWEKWWGNVREGWDWGHVGFVCEEISRLLLKRGEPLEVIWGKSTGRNMAWRMGGMQKRIWSCGLPWHALPLRVKSCINPSKPCPNL